MVSDKLVVRGSYDCAVGNSLTSCHLFQIQSNDNLDRPPDSLKRRIQSPKLSSIAILRLRHKCQRLFMQKSCSYKLMTLAPHHNTHAEEMYVAHASSTNYKSLTSCSARRYAHHLQTGRQIQRTDTLGVRTNLSATLTKRNVLVHNTIYGQKPAARFLCETWLDGVVEAMSHSELEHPPPAPWDLEARTEEIRVNPEDRPADEWDSIIRRNGVRYRDRRIHRDACGNMSER